MTLRERLRTLARSLPADGSVVLTRTALEELLDGGQEPSAGDASVLPDLTVAQVAERFDRTEQTVRDWIKAGKLEAYKFNDREYRVTWAAVIEFEEQQRTAEPRETTAHPPPLSKWRDA